MKSADVFRAHPRVHETSIEMPPALRLGTSNERERSGGNSDKQGFLHMRAVAYRATALPANANGLIQQPIRAERAAAEIERCARRRPVKHPVIPNPRRRWLAHGPYNPSYFDDVSAIALSISRVRSRSAAGLTGPVTCFTMRPRRLMT